jgi:hypothetical protein
MNRIGRMLLVKGGLVHQKGMMSIVGTICVEGVMVKAELTAVKGMMPIGMKGLAIGKGFTGPMRAARFSVNEGGITKGPMKLPSNIVVAKGTVGVRT